MIIRQEFSSLRQGLVGAWCPSLGASGLTLIDRSGRNNHGVLTNMAGQDNWQARGSGVALGFDGTNDFVAVGRLPQIESQSRLTVSMWASFVQTPSSQFSFFSYGSSNGFTSDILFGYASDVFFVQINNGTDGNNAYSATVAGMNHYLFTFDGTQSPASDRVKLFINATEIPYATSFSYPSTTSTSATHSARIGSYISFPSGWYFPGQIDDVRIYNRALTLSEIRLLASRRGIGLVPLPDRAAGLPRKLFVNDAGTWRNGDAYVNTGSEWRLGVPFVNDAGTWR
jgi:hypothetical protein